MRIIPSQIAAALLDLEAEGTVPTSTLAKNTLGWLRRHRSGTLLKSLVRETELRSLERKGMERVLITSAHALSSAAKEELHQQAARLFPGKTLQMEFRVDETLIGGVRIESQNARWDASIAQRLEKLEAVLTH